MPLYLIRHGETEFNVAKRYQGQNDSPLTANGISQARRNGQVLADLHLDKSSLRIIASPLGRTMDTAAYICKAMGIDPAKIETDAQLMEMHYGVWQGMTAEEIEHKYPGEWGKRMDNIATYDIPGGGESYNVLMARVGDWITSTQTGWESDVSWIVVSHGGTGSVVRGLYTGLDIPAIRALPLPQDQFFKLHNGEISTL